MFQAHLQRICVMGFAAIGLAILLFGISPDAAFAQYTDIGNSEFGNTIESNYSAWDPETQDWTNSNQKGYSEGQVVPFLIPWKLDQGDQRRAVVCLDYQEKNAPNSYRFIDLAPFNEDYDVSPRNGPITSDNLASSNPPFGDIAAGVIQSDYATIDTAEFIDPAICGSGGGKDFIAFRIEFTVGTGPGGQTTDIEGFIYFGARLAAPGLTTVLGATVGSGQGASGPPSGNFQSFLKEVNGNRTVQFAPGDILPFEADLALIKSCPAFANGEPYFYTIEVTNLGQGSATDVTIADQLPSYIDYTGYTSKLEVNGVPQPQGICTENPVDSNQITCELQTGLLPTDATDSYKWIVTLEFALTDDTGDYINSATVSATEFDPDDTNNTGQTPPCGNPLAVTVGYVNASRTGGQVDFSWQTVSETGTAGFNIMANGAPLNAELIPSTVVDSVVPTDYSFSAVTDADVYYLEEVSVDGKVSQMGPYEVGVEYGSYVSTDAIVPAIYLPLMQR